jgi:hypothetical protein
VPGYGRVCALGEVRTRTPTAPLSPNSKDFGDGGGLSRRGFAQEVCARDYGISRASVIAIRDAVAA